jgi:hypothetical protein
MNDSILLGAYKEDKYAITKTIFYLKRHVAEFLGLHDAVFTKIMFQYCSSTERSAFFFVLKIRYRLKLQWIKYYFT